MCVCTQWHTTGIASIPSQPDYLYLVAEFETADSGSTQRSSRMYKYSIAQDRLVDSCKLKVRARTSALAAAYFCSCD